MASRTPARFGSAPKSTSCPERRRNVRIACPYATWRFGYVYDRKDYFRRQQSKTFCDCDQYRGLVGGTPDSVASGEGGDRRRGPPRGEERTGRRGNALQVFWSKCGLVAIGGDRSQRVDGLETTGAARRAVAGSTQATALPDFQHRRSAGAPCAQSGTALGGHSGRNCPLAGGSSVVARGHLKLTSDFFVSYRRIIAPFSQGLGKARPLLFHTLFRGPSSPIR